MESEKPVAEETTQLVEDAPVSKMTRAEFITRLDQLIAEGDAAGLPTAQIIAARFAKASTSRVTSFIDNFFDSLVTDK